VFLLVLNLSFEEYVFKEPSVLKSYGMKETSIQKILSLLLVGIAVIICMSLPASAAGGYDPTGDVLHWGITGPGTPQYWSENVSDKPNIDITEIHVTVSRGSLILSLTVAGTIQYSSSVEYSAWYNSTDAEYSWSWSNGTLAGNSCTHNGTIVGRVQNLTVSGNKISVLFDEIGNSTTKDMFGYTSEYLIQPYQMGFDHWEDMAGENYKFTNTTRTHGSSDQTPGFDAVLVIGAISLTYIMLKRRN
jgi:hypothetical protein